MSEVSPEARVWDLLRGALATRALALVADLRIAEALAEGPRPVQDIAREVGADPDKLHRILRALASDDVFAEEEHGVFRNTDASKLLRRGDGWDDFAHLFGGGENRGHCKCERSAGAHGQVGRRPTYELTGGPLTPANRSMVPAIHPPLNPGRHPNP